MFYPKFNRFVMECNNIYNYLKINLARLFEICVDHATVIIFTLPNFIMAVDTTKTKRYNFNDILIKQVIHNYICYFFGNI